MKLVALAHSSDDPLDFLNKRKICLGITLEILSSESFDGSMSVKYADRTDNLSKLVCDALYVESQ